jgi:hypothetical protein
MRLSYLPLGIVAKEPWGRKLSLLLARRARPGKSPKYRRNAHIHWAVVVDG